MGLRLRLILLILLPVIVTVVVAGTIAYISVRSHLLDSAREDALHSAEDLAFEVSTRLAADASVPGLLASIDPSIYGSPGDYYQAIEQVIPALLADSNLFNLGIFFEPGVVDGRSYALTWFLREPSGAITELRPNLPGNQGYTSEEPVYDYPSQDWFVVGRAVPGLTWTEPYFDAGGANIPMVTATFPVRDGETILGVATTDIPLEKLRGLLSSSRLTPNSYVIMVSAQGRFITHQRHPELELADTVAAAAARLSSDGLWQLERELTTGLEGVLPINDPWSGAAVWASYAAVPTTGWSVIVITPLADVLAPIKPLEQTFLGTAAALAAALVGLVWLVSTWFLRPVRALSEGVARIASGDLRSVTLKIRRRDELGRLAANFEQMASKVARSQTDLEATVAARTDELQQALALQQGQALALQHALDESRAQREVIAALGTPVIPLRRDTLVVPIIGGLDSERAARLLADTLAAVEARGAYTVILDITGLPFVDADAARALVNLAESVRLLGAQALLVGISPEVAQSLVALDVDLGQLRSLGTLEAAVDVVLRSRPAVVGVARPGAPPEGLH